MPNSQNWYETSHFSNEGDFGILGAQMEPSQVREAKDRDAVKGISVPGNLEQHLPQFADYTYCPKAKTSSKLSPAPDHQVVVHEFYTLQTTGFSHNQCSLGKVLERKGDTRTKLLCG